MNNDFNNFQNFSNKFPQNNNDILNNIPTNHNSNIVYRRNILAIRVGDIDDKLKDKNDFYCEEPNEKIHKKKEDNKTYLTKNGNEFPKLLDFEIQKIGKTKYRLQHKLKYDEDLFKRDETLRSQVINPVDQETKHHT